MSFNRFRSNSNQSQSQRKASRFIRNEALVVSVGTSGLLAPRFEGGLALPYASIGVETQGGKRYILQVRGREATNLDGVQPGMTVKYAGNFIFYKQVGDALRGGYFLASRIEITNRTINPYVTGLVAATEQYNQEHSDE